MLRLAELLHGETKKFKLPKLQYKVTDLKPIMKTFETHYTGHHGGYIKKLNKNIQNTKFEFMPLQKMIAKSQGHPDIYNNAAQHYNHTFLWNCWSPNGGGKPKGQLMDDIEYQFGSYADFKKKFIEMGTNHFGSGWMWFHKDGKKLILQDMHDADCPVVLGTKPLLVCDLWEHAYYLDYKNDREKFIKATFDIIDWNFVMNNYMEN